MKTNLNLEEFNPKKAELVSLRKKYEILTKKDWLEKISEWRKDLKKNRTELTRVWKEMRDEANKFRTAVIKKEKELIAEIEPEEKRLQEIENQIKEELEIEKRKKGLPARRQRLDEILFTEITDEEILKMNWEEFDNFFREKKENFSEAEIMILKLQSDKTFYENFTEHISDFKQHLIWIKIKEKFFSEKIKIAEKNYEEYKKFEDDKKKLEETKKALEKAENDRKIEEQRQAELKKIAENTKLEAEKKHKEEIERIKKEVEEKKKLEEYERKIKIEKEKSERIRLEKQEKYKKFREKFWYSEKTKDDFFQENKSWVVTLWKKCWEFKI